MPHLHLLLGRMYETIPRSHDTSDAMNRNRTPSRGYGFIFRPYRRGFSARTTDDGSCCRGGCDYAAIVYVVAAVILLKYFKDISR